MIDGMGYDIRMLRRDEVDSAVEWADREGWNPGLRDGDCFFAADSGGFLGGFLDGRLIATISAVRYGDTFGFIGFYIVAPEHRGKGFGYRLWQAAIAHLGDRCIGLDGVVDQQDNYRKSGFNLAYRNVRYEGRVTKPSGDAETIALRDVPINQVIAYDAALFPAPREVFMRAWLSHHGAAVVESGELKGFGVIRPCRSGWKVGPLLADSPDIARRLFGALCVHVGEGGIVYLDTPQCHGAAVALAEAHGMSVVFETARMYRGQKPTIDTDRIFGVTTFELG